MWWRWLRLPVQVLLGLLCHCKVATDPDSQLRAFYAAESQRKLLLSGGQTPPFDVIVLNVCSLGWDDMEFVGMKDHPLMQRFDVVFTQFNTGASYSGPGMIRLMHGTCGQMPQKPCTVRSIHSATLPQPGKIGYRTAGLMNHDGVTKVTACRLKSTEAWRGKF